ncbi:hypothetical protein L345_04199, partial [Ophiophagus hannah]
MEHCIERFSACCALVTGAGKGPFPQSIPRFIQNIALIESDDTINHHGNYCDVTEIELGHHWMNVEKILNTKDQNFRVNNALKARVLSKAFAEKLKYYFIRIERREGERVDSEVEILVPIQVPLDLDLYVPKSDQQSPRNKHQKRRKVLLITAIHGYHSIQKLKNTDFRVYINKYFTTSSLTRIFPHLLFLDCEQKESHLSNVYLTQTDTWMLVMQLRFLQQIAEDTPANDFYLNPIQCSPFSTSSWKIQKETILAISMSLQLRIASNSEFCVSPEHWANLIKMGK